MLKNVAIITSKNPNLDVDMDGGSILTQQLVKYLPKKANLVDVYYLRSSKNIKLVENGINTVNIVEVECYSKNKFMQRVEQEEQVVKLVEEIGERYDCILVVHISNTFGFNRLNERIRKKVIVFPMFTSYSYMKSGEEVPDIYIYKEKEAFHAVKFILTPSVLEKEIIRKQYDIEESKIQVIPRGINLGLFKVSSPNKGSQKINIIYIAAIRAQKNHKHIIQMCKYLRSYNINFCMHLVGGYEKTSKEEFMKLVKENNLEEYIQYHGTMPQVEMIRLLEQCQLNISVSNMETFGRGIYEGLLMGIPTIVYRHLTCLWEHLKEGEGIVAVDNSPEAMGEKIISILEDRQLYNSLRNKALQYREVFSEENIVEQMILTMKRVVCNE